MPLAKISPELQHAVISAEDGRFYQHHGIDWDETEKVAQESQEKGELVRGASTITAAVGEEPVLHHASQSGAESVRVHAGADGGLDPGQAAGSGIVFERGGVGSVRVFTESRRARSTTITFRRRGWIAINRPGWRRFCRRRGGGVRRAWMITARSFWRAWRRRGGDLA